MAVSGQAADLGLRGHEDTMGSPSLFPARAAASRKPGQAWSLGAQRPRPPTPDESETSGDMPLTSDCVHQSPCGRGEHKSHRLPYLDVDHRRLCEPGSTEDLTRVGSDGKQAGPGNADGAAGSLQRQPWFCGCLSLGAPGKPQNQQAAAMGTGLRPLGGTS